MEPVFRAARNADTAFLLGSMQSLYAEDGGTPFDAVEAGRALHQLLHDQALGRVWVMEAAGARVGYLAVTWGFSLEYHGRHAFIDELFVLPSHRDRGLGVIDEEVVH